MSSLPGTGQPLIPAGSKTFCSLVRGGRKGLDITQLKLEECLDIIIHTLAKEILCYHDTLDLTVAYKRICILEEGAEKRKISGLGNLVCEKVKTQFKTRVASKNLTGRDLSTLYFLSNFRDYAGNLILSADFMAYFKPLDKKIKDELVHEIPVCITKDYYRKSVEFLSGGVDEAFFTLKIDRFQQFHQREERTSTERLVALQKRHSQPETFPGYMLDLIQLGHIELYKHLREMQMLTKKEDRTAYAYKMPFLEIAKVVLQTKEAIIDRVRSQVASKKSPVVILIGDTGVGKSTSLCFLRGDTMELDQQGRYSSKEDKEIIGLDDKASQTFLPNITTMEEMTLIDFPGFNDSKGPLVSLGMELALKALAKKYRPKFLFFCSMKDSGQKLATVIAPQAARLQRILGNTDNCLLGLTHYTQYQEFNAITKIEKEQVQALLVQEKEIKVRKQGLEEGMSLMALAIQDKQLLKMALEPSEKQLGELEKERLKVEQELKLLQQEGLFPDTDEKKRLRLKIEEREKQFQDQTKIAELMRFSELKDRKLRANCLRKLLQPSRGASTTPYLILDAEYESLLKARFKQDLLPKVCQIKLDTRKALLNRLERCILSKSYIYFLTNEASEQFAEVGDFLHLPEMDPSIVQGYDKEIAKESVEAVIASIVLGIDLEFYQNHIKKYEGKDFEGSKRIDGKVSRLVGGVKELLGKEVSKGVASKERQSREQKEWQELREQNERKYASQMKAIDSKYTLPMWKKILMGVPLGIPLILHNQEWEQKKEEKKKEYLIDLREEMLQLETQVDMLQEIFTLLKRIKVMIEKRSDLDSEFGKISISLESSEKYKTSVKSKIGVVRNKYGQELWDHSVQEWVTRIFPKGFHLTWNTEDDKLLDYGLQICVAFLVGTIFDSSIKWKCKIGNKEIIYSWYDFQIDRSLHDLEPQRKDSPGIEIVRKRGDQEEILISKELQTLSPELLEAFRLIWNNFILPRLGDLVSTRTPLTLAMLGAVFLKKWEQ